jgi:histone deacetylase HOS3
MANRSTDYSTQDGKPELVQAASASIHGAHGQYIENIHLQKYSLEEDFWTKLYKNQYSRLFEKAEEFIKATGNGRDDTIVFVR